MLQPARICEYHHSVSWPLRTGSKDFSLVVLYHTKTACAVCGKFRVVTEGRNIDTCFANHREYVFLICKFDFLFVDCHESHSYSSYHSICIASKAQSDRQAPHLMQASLSI